MTDPAQFAIVKELYAQVCDLPEAERLAALQAASSDAVVIAEVLKLCAASRETERFAKPVLDALGRIGSPASQSGDVLGAWTLQDEIGQGGMGRVYRARRSDGHFEQVAAVKLLSGVASPSALAHLARERQILASLVHPNIARLLDGGATPQGQPFLVMEYVEGQPIDIFCRERGLDPAQILRLFIDICAAVSYAHQNLIIHCDLKPSNILVSRDGRPILLDFGISRLLGDASSETPSAGADAAAEAPSAIQSSVAYTRLYASPEQIGFARVSTASDVYSLGVTLAEVLGVDVIESQPLALAGLPRDLAAIIERATQPKALQRYVSADALAADLLRYLGHLPVQARAPSLAYVGGRWLQRRWPWALAGVLFVAIVSMFYLRMRVERNNALQAERTALAVKDYMVSVFQGADPEVSGQRDLALSEVLSAGRVKLNTELGDQPQVRAELIAILAGVYLNIGKRDQAITLYQEAIALERGNARPHVLAKLLHKQAYAIYDLEDFPRAEPIAREALALHEQLAPESVELIDSLRLLGTILLYQDRREESLALLTRALQMAERVSGADSVQAARVHLDMGRFHVWLDGFPTAAIPHARKARAIFAQHYGTDHYLYVNALEALSVALGYTGGFDEGLPLARETSEKRIKLYGEISNQAGFALYAYADMLGRAGRRLEAIPVLERCLDIQARLDGSDKLAATIPLIRLGRVLLEAGVLDGTAERFERVIKVRMDVLKKADYQVTDARFYLGRVLRLRGELAAAEPLLTVALEANRASPSAYQLVKTQLEMATLRRQQGRLDEASALLVAINRESYADAPWRAGFEDAEQAQIAAAKGDHATALRLYLQAEAQLASGLGPEHPDVWLQKLDRAELLVAMGEGQAARALATQIALKARTSIAPGGDWARRLQALGAQPAPL
jgi:tetratricopeptide (TPR) repeat protein